MMPELTKWLKLFSVYGFDISPSDIDVRPKSANQNLYILSPKELTNTDLVRLYTFMAKNFTNCGFMVSECAFKLLDEPSSYSRYVRAGAVELHGELVIAVHDETMTIRESMLHDIWMWYHYESEYNKLFPYGFTNYCRGTILPGTNRSLLIEFDPGDVKFVLTLH